MNAMAGAMSTVNLPLPIPAALIAESVESSTEAAPTQEPRKPRVWTVFAVWFAAFVVGNFAVAVFLGTAVAAVMISLMTPGADPLDTMPRVQEILSQPLLATMVTLVPYQIGMLVVLMLAARLSKTPTKERIGLVPESGRKVGLLRLLLLAGFTGSAAQLIWVAFAAIWSADAADATATSAAADAPWWTISIVAFLFTFVPAIVEELFFRGYLQGRLLQRWSPAVALTVSTALFAIVHCDSLQHIVAVIPLGVVLGLLAWRTGSVKAGMIVHAIHNAGMFAVGAVALALTDQMGEEAFGLAALGVLAWLLLAGTFPVISLMRKTNVEPETDPFADYSPERRAAAAMIAA